jgi:hypothetical protein
MAQCPEYVARFGEPAEPGDRAYTLSVYTRKRV